MDKNSPEMYYHKGALKWTKFFLVESNIEDPTVQLDPLRKYWYPGWWWGGMLYYRSINSIFNIKNLVDKCSKLYFSLKDGKKSKAVINHVIGSDYKDGTDYIRPHSDKMRDI